MYLLDQGWWWSQQLPDQKANTTSLDQCTDVCLVDALHKNN